MVSFIVIFGTISFPIVKMKDRYTIRYLQGSRYYLEDRVLNLEDSLLHNTVRLLELRLIQSNFESINNSSTSAVCHRFLPYTEL